MSKLNQDQSVGRVRLEINDLEVKRSSFEGILEATGTLEVLMLIKYAQQILFFTSLHHATVPIFSESKQRNEGGFTASSDR